MKKHPFFWTSFGLCLLSFGVLIPQLGFYWDDWLVVFHLQADRLVDLATLYSYDRPFSVWTAWLFGPLLGARPAAWQLFTLLVRWLTVLAMWWSLSMLWPKRRWLPVAASLLFALYPSFFLQSISVAYSQHWLTYLLFLISLTAMGKAGRWEQKRWRWTLLALGTALLHSLTLEYYIGLELIRPLYLWMIWSGEEADPLSKGKRVVRHWLPYLLLWIGVAMWRLFLLELPVDPHKPELLLALRQSPLATSIEFAQTALLSLWRMLAGVWLELLIVDVQVADWLPWLIGLAAGAGIWWAKGYLVTERRNNDDPLKADALALIFALAAILLGLLPAFIIQESVLERGYNERFTLPAMFGAAIMWVLLLGLIKNEKLRWALLAVLIMVAALGQVSASQDFVDDWRQQQRFYQQLAWRAPDIESDTALVSFLQLSPIMQNSSLSVAINTLYEQSTPSTVLDYWNFDIRRTRNERPLSEGDALSMEYRGMRFEAEDAGSVLFWYPPENGCLWLLRPVDVANEYVPSQQRDLVALSNPERITNARGNNLGGALFNAEKSSEWCYYFEKADLAAQLGDWPEVLELMKEAERLGLEPHVEIEWLPLLRAFAHSDQWAKAEELSERIGGEGKELLCAQWQDFIDVEEVVVPQESSARIAELASCQF